MANLKQLMLVLDKNLLDLNKEKLKKKVFLLIFSKMIWKTNRRGNKFERSKINYKPPMMIWK